MCNSNSRIFFRSVIISRCINVSSYFNSVKFISNQVNINFTADIFCNSTSINESKRIIIKWGRLSLFKRLSANAVPQKVQRINKRDINITIFKINHLVENFMLRILTTGCNYRSSVFFEIIFKNFN